MTDLIPAPRPVPSPEDRMAAARTDTPPTTDPAPTHPGRSFRTWMSDTDRDQLDARAAAAEQERDDALDDLQAVRAERDALRQRADTLTRQRDNHAAQADRLSAALDRTNTGRTRLQEQLDDMATQLNMARTDVAIARTDVHHDIARQIDILAADPGILRDWLTTCDPQPVSFGELLHALAEKLRRPSPPSSVPPRRAQDALTDRQRDRDRAEHAIRDRLSAAWPQFDDRVFLDQVAAEAAVAAVEELARPAEARP